MPSLIIPHDLSTILDASKYTTEGFCEGWEVRRHKHESVANQASYEARQDWLRLVGPTQEFGSCNPPNGNWTALAMPFCLAERFWITSYIIEFAFIHDTEIERQLPDGSEDHTDLSSSTATAVLDPQVGKKKIRAKMASELLKIDPIRGKECLLDWQNMIDTTHREKRTSFKSVEEYVEFRLVDCSARWMASLMAYGMGITLPVSEKERLKHVIWPFCAAAGLENDYFSFDKEYAEFLEQQEEARQQQGHHDNHDFCNSFNNVTARDRKDGRESDSGTSGIDDDDADKYSCHHVSMKHTATTDAEDKPYKQDKPKHESEQNPSTPIILNLIPLLISLNIAHSIPHAKQLTREITIGYEREFDRRIEEYREDYLSRHPTYRMGEEDTEKALPMDIEMYLIGLKYILSGNIVWSSNCPRYHVDMRYDPNAGLEDMMSREIRGKDWEDVV